MGDFDYSTNYEIAAAIVGTVSLFGFISNLTVVFFLRMMPSLNNSFGSLTLSQAVADCCHQAMFAFYFAPCLFLDYEQSEFPYSSRNYQIYSWSADFGAALIFIYEICGMSHLCISINRFMAVYASLIYTKIFSTRNVRFLIFFFWSFSAVTTLYTLRLIDCAFYLPQGQWMFIYKDTPICDLVEWYWDFIKYVIFVIIVAVLDFCSILRIHNLHSQHANSLQDTVSSQRRSRERNLVYQTAMQGIFFISELVTYFVLSPYARNKWDAFLLTTMSWCMVHATDGFIVLLFNQDFRLLIKKRLFAQQKTNVISIAMKSAVSSNMYPSNVEDGTERSVSNINF